MRKTISAFMAVLIAFLIFGCGSPEVKPAAVTAATEVYQAYINTKSLKKATVTLTRTVDGKDYSALAGYGDNGEYNLTYSLEENGEVQNYEIVSINNQNGDGTFLLYGFKNCGFDSEAKDGEDEETNHTAIKQVISKEDNQKIHTALTLHTLFEGDGYVGFDGLFTYPALFAESYEYSDYDNGESAVYIFTIKDTAVNVGYAYTLKVAVENKIITSIERSYIPVSGKEAVTDYKLEIKSGFSEKTAVFQDKYDEKIGVKAYGFKTDYSFIFKLPANT